MVLSQLRVIGQGLPDSWQSRFTPTSFGAERSLYLPWCDPLLAGLGAIVVN